MNEPPQFFEHSGADPGTQVESAIIQPLTDSARSLVELSAEAALPMVEHVAELRNRILICVACLAATLGLGFYFALPIIELFQHMAPGSIEFVQLTPGEVLIASLRVAFYVGFGLSLPVILYHILRFVLPGLLPHERGMVSWSLIGGTGLFIAGAVFAYFFVVPSALIFLVDYGQSVAKTQLSIESYIGFCSALLFVTGLMFELPMVLFLLSLTGLLTSQKLIQEWRWATILIFIAAAVVTPTQDPFSMSLVGLAMVGLYAFSIIPIKLSGR